MNSLQFCPLALSLNSKISCKIRDKTNFNYVVSANFFSHQTLHSDTTYLCIQLMLCDPSQILVLCAPPAMKKSGASSARRGSSLWLLLVEERGCRCWQLLEDRIFQKGAPDEFQRKRSHLTMIRTLNLSLLIA